MNATEITALSTAALREYAKTIGVKRSATDTKATLAAKVIAAVEADAPAIQATKAERQASKLLKAEAETTEVVEVVAIGTPDEIVEVLHEAAAPIAVMTPSMENEAKVFQAKKAKKLCGICKTRPVSNSQELPLGIKGTMCTPCYDESGWENTHSDHGHDRINALVEAAAELSTTDQDELDSYMASCWICHPELNEASESYVPRKGTSRAGMVMNTGHNWAPKTKADVIAAAVKEAGGTSKTKSEDGNLVITVRLAGGSTMKLAWDAQGSYVYAKSVWTVPGSIKSIKVRNVAAALRLIKG